MRMRCGISAKHCWRLPPATILILIGAGCGAGADNAGNGYSVRDSAGVRIIQNGSSTTAEICSVASEPRLDIGVVEGAPEYRFFRIADAMTLADGRITVVNAGSHQIRIYGPDGRFLREFGREGDGPGEFGFPLRIWQRHDSLVVYDAGRQRLAWFTMDGVFARGVALRPSYVNFPLLFLLADGRSVILKHVFRVPASGFVEQPLYMILHGADGHVADTLGVYSLGRMGQVGPPGYTFVAGPIFQARTFVAARRDRIVVGRGIHRELEVMNPDGRILQLIRWTGPDRSITEEAVQRFRESHLAQVESPSERTALRLRLLDRPVAERFPALGEIRIGRAGRIWVRMFQRPTWEAKRWLIFDVNRTLLCRIRIPEGFSITEIGPDYVLGVWYDDLDVEHIRIYGLSPAPGEFNG